MPVIHNPFDDEKLVQIRKDQADPIAQYYIVRKDIPMSAAKIGAQIGHGAQMFAFFYKDQKAKGEDSDRIKLTDEWADGSFRKIILGGKFTDFEKVKAALEVFVVRDAGLTEIEPGTETVLVTWPMRKSQRPKILVRLQAL